MTVAEPLLVKVRKLLAKAEATSNPHEADAFAAKAAALIATHRIDAARLAAAGSTEPLAIRSVPMGRGAYVRARLALLGAVAGSHDCELVWVSTADGAVAKVAGFTSDLDATVVLYESLHLQAAARMAGVRRPTGAATQRWRRAFLFGYAARVGQLLAETRRDVEDHAPAPVGEGRDAARPARAGGPGPSVRQHGLRSGGAGVGAGRRRGQWVEERGHREASSADLGRARLAGRPQIGPA